MKKTMETRIAALTVRCHFLVSLLMNECFTHINPQTLKQYSYLIRIQQIRKVPKARVPLDISLLVVSRINQHMYISTIHILHRLLKNNLMRDA